MEKEKPVESIEDVQKSFKEQVQMQLSTILAEEKYSQIMCAAIVTNVQTGRIDIISFKMNLVMQAKALLQEAIDMLGRQQVVTAIGQMFLVKEQKEKE